MSDVEVIVSEDKPSASDPKGSIDRKTAVFTRDSILSELTRLVSYANNHEKGPLRMLQVRSELLNELRTRFLAAQLDCEMSAQTEEETEAEKNIRVAFEDDYIDTMVLYKELIAALKSENATSEAANTETVQATESQKLAPLDLPRFSGQYEDWISFKNSFTQIMKEYVPEGDEIRQLMYLKKALAAEPATLISALETSAENYKVAWDILNKRYNKNWAIISAHLRKVFDVKKPGQAKKNPKTTLNWITLARQHIISLKSLSAANPDLDLLSATLIYLLSSNIDDRTKGEWDTFMASKQDPVALNDFFEFIEERCSGFNVTDEVEENKKPESVKRENENKNAKKDQQAAKRVKTEVDRCAFCSGYHKSFNCNGYKSANVKERIAKIKEKSLCANCLKPDCRPFKCTLEAQCKICHKNHHSSLHVYKGSAGEGNASAGSTAPGFRASNNENYNHFPVLGVGPGGNSYGLNPPWNNSRDNPSWTG